MEDKIKKIKKILKSRKSEVYSNVDDLDANEGKDVEIITRADDIKKWVEKDEYEYALANPDELISYVSNSENPDELRWYVDAYFEANKLGEIYDDDEGLDEFEDAAAEGMYWGGLKAHDEVKKKFETEGWNNPKLIKVSGISFDDLTPDEIYEVMNVLGYSKFDHQPTLYDLYKTNNEMEKD